MGAQYAPRAGGMLATAAISPCSICIVFAFFSFFPRVCHFCERYRPRLSDTSRNLLTRKLSGGDVRCRKESKAVSEIDEAYSAVLDAAVLRVAEPGERSRAFWVRLAGVASTKSNK